MIVAINYSAVLVAAVASFIVGALWYGPIFGQKWSKMMGFTPESMENMRLSPSQVMALGFVAAVITSYVLAYLVSALSVSSLLGAVQLAFWLWLGFYFTTAAGVWLWEGKSPRLWLFNAAYYLLSLAVASSIIALWP